MAALRKIAVLTAALATAPAQVFAGPVVGGNCEIGKAIDASSVVYWDLNGNGVWNGIVGGDASSVINFATGAGSMFVGDWNGDGIIDAGKLNGTIHHVDLNGNRAWNGTVGGDRSTNFAAFAGTGVPLGGDWDNDGSDEIGRYVDAVGGFYLDLNGDGIWNGSPTDRGVAFAAFAGSGAPVIGDWNGDGADDVGRYVGTAFYLDLNGNGAWNGSGAGDFAGNFAASFGAGIPVVGDWNGDGDDEIGVYVPGTSVFLIDLNGNRVWNGNAGGDLQVALNVAAGAGVPVTCDWDGDGDDNTGRQTGGVRYIIDLNGNNVWNGVVGGDRDTNFAIGGAGDPIGGVVNN